MQSEKISNSALIWENSCIYRFFWQNIQQLSNFELELVNFLWQPEAEIKNGVGFKEKIV